MRQFKLNSEMPWNFADRIPENINVWVLCEEDTCDPTSYPFILLVRRNSGEMIKLVDYDPETQEDFFQNNRYEIIAWRHLTDHKHTFDKTFIENPELIVFNNSAETLPLTTE